MSYELDATDRRLAASVMRDVSPEKRQSVRLIHERALKTLYERRATRERQAAAEDRAIALRELCLHYLDEAECVPAPKDSAGEA